MLNKEELKVLVEREGISEFYNVIDSFYQEETESTIYELETDYYAVMYRVFPPAYAGNATEEVISSAVTCGLPVNSVVQFHQICSKNISQQIHSYDSVIVEDVEALKLDNAKMLQELHDAQVEFLNKHVEVTVFEKKKLAFYLRDFLNTVTVLIPMRDKNNNLRSPQDLVPFLSKLKGSMFPIFPQDINEHQHIRIMRELLTPYNPMPECFRDPHIDIRSHYTDIDSAMEDIGDGMIKLCRTRALDFDKQEGEFKQRDKGFLAKSYDKFNNLFFPKEEEVDHYAEKTAVSDDVYYAKVMSRKMFPEYADLHTMTDLTMDYFNKNVQQQIPLSYAVSLSVKIEDVSKAIDEVKQSAMWNKWQLDNIGKLGQYFPELQMRAAEADDVLNVIDRLGDIPMKAEWKMVVYSKNKQDLEYYSSIIRADYQRRGFVIQDEDLLAMNVFMYSLPMKYDEIYREESKRYQTIFKSNVATVAPMGTDSRGFGQDPVILFFGRNGQPQGFDFYDRNASNKNAVVIAPSGQGKSFFAQRIVWSYLKSGAKIRIIDSGHSYRELCAQVGGQYITFPENSGICLNPFSDARLDLEGNLHEDEVSNIVNLVGVMAGFDLTENNTNETAEIVNALSSYISEAVRKAHIAEHDNTGMEHVGDALRVLLKNIRQNARVDGDIRDGDVDRKLPGLITSLQDFTNKNGLYYSYVNGPSNITFKKNLVVLDMDDLSSKQKRFKDFVVTTVTNSVEREFYKDRHIDQRKLFLIDEAWQLLDGKAGSVILGLYRRARKMQGSMITITQSINDFYLNDNIRGIFENAYWRLFLQQDSSVMQTAMDEKKLVIDSYAFSLLETVETKIGEYSEVMVMTQPGDLIIGRTLATRVEYWISTQDERDVRTVLEVADRYGISNGEARIAIGYSEMHNKTVEEEISKLFGFEELAAEAILNDGAA